MDPNPRRVLFVDYYSFLGGAQANLLSVFKKLDRRRYQPFLAVPSEGPFSQNARQLKVPVFLVPMGKARWRRPWEAWSAMRSLLGIIREQQIKLVHSNCYPANKLAGPAAAFAGIPALWHKQIAVTQKPGSSTGRLWKFYSRFNPKVIGVSQQVIEGLAALGIERSKLHLLYNNADVEELNRYPPLKSQEKRKWGIPSRSPLVGSAGMHRYHKGFDIFLKACALIAHQNLKAHFLLIGDKAHAEEGHEALLETLAQDPVLKGRLHMIPAQSPLAPWLRAFDVFVSSSRWEGSPLVVLEAMALSRPVVATLAAAGELIKDGKEGFVVSGEDAKALAQKVVHLLKRKSLASRIGRAAKQRVIRDFSLPVYVAKLMDFYDSVLDAHYAAK